MASIFWTIDSFHLGRYSIINHNTLTCNFEMTWFNLEIGINYKLILLSISWSLILVIVCWFHTTCTSLYIYILYTLRGACPRHQALCPWRFYMLHWLKLIPWSQILFVLTYAFGICWYETFFVTIIIFYIQNIHHPNKYINNIWLSMTHWELFRLGPTM